MKTFTAFVVLLKFDSSHASCMGHTVAPVNFNVLHKSRLRLFNLVFQATLKKKELATVLVLFLIHLQEID